MILKSISTGQDQQRIPCPSPMQNVGRNLKPLYDLKYPLLILFCLSLLNCSTNDSETQPKQRITVTKYEIIKDSIEIVSILKKIYKQGTTIDYQDFVGKLLRMTFSNNSNENIYLLKPLHEDESENMLNNFTASIHLFQASNDSIKWDNIFYRLPVDTYDADYDTIKSKTTITKFAYLDNNKKSKYLRLLLEYKSDSSYFNDTIQIVNSK